MALPTRAQVRTTCLQWLQEALDAQQRPRLPVLRSRLARMVTGTDAERSSVSCAVNTIAGPPVSYELVITLQRWDAQGAPLADVVLTYSSTDLPPNAVMGDFDDIVDDSSGKRSRRDHRNGLLRLLGKSLVK